MRSLTPRAGSPDLTTRLSPQTVWLVRVWIAATLMGSSLHAPDALRARRSVVLTSHHPKSATTTRAYGLTVQHTGRDHATVCTGPLFTPRCRVPPAARTPAMPPRAPARRAGGAGAPAPGAQQRLTGARHAVIERGAEATRRRGGRKGALFCLSVCGFSGTRTSAMSSSLPKDC